MSKNFSTEEKKYMKLALELAIGGNGSVSPNPLVGAVLVKGNKIIGQGYHKKIGGNHAEVEAINSVDKIDIKDSVMYVTLEPCCHFKKRTPPCVKYIINMGLKEVVAATLDPNPNVNGKGIEELRNAGVSVRIGLMEKEAKKLNEVYFKNMSTSLPFVVLKLGLSLDGKIAYASGEPKWVTNECSRKCVHEMRNIFDAVLTTSNTVLADNPHLGVRHVKGRDPLRIIIDRMLRTPINSLVYRDENVLLVTTDAASIRKIEEYKSNGIDMLILQYDFRIEELLRILYERGIYSILIEAGSKFAAIMVNEGLIDKYLFFYTPRIIGSDGVSGLDRRAITNTDFIKNLNKVKVSDKNGDILIEAYPK